MSQSLSYKVLKPRPLVLQKGPTPKGLPLSSSEIQPPAQLYVQQGEQLAIFAWSSVATTLTFYARMLFESGVIQTMTLGSLTTTSDRSQNTKTVFMPQGYVLGLSVNSVGNLLGQTFLKVGIAAPPSEGSNILGQILFSDYVSPGYSPVYPNGPIRKSTDGPGYLTSYSTGRITGGNASLTVPTGARWKIRSVHATLVTSSATTTRTIVLQIENIQCIPTTTVGANADREFYYNPAFGGSTDRDISILVETSGYPENYVLPAGGQIVAALFNGDLNDQTQLTATVEELIDV